MGNASSYPILSEEERSLFSADKHDYDFENLAFNGGGAKCIAQVGTLKAFEETGILPQIKRFAGTSGGSITATLAALGYPACEIEHILINTNLERLALGRTCGCFSYFKYIYNFLKYFGLHTAESFDEWLGRLVKTQLGNEDATFYQLYKERGMELAITSSDVVRQRPIIYHFKTTPDMKIRLAVRMSVSIPGYFTPVPFNNGLFVDGGTLRNYPIMVYDGWFLSLKPEDGFLKKFKFQNPNQPDTLEDFYNEWDLQKRFGPPQGKTVGVMVYSAFQQDAFKVALDKRSGALKPQQFPNTKLAKKRGKELDAWKKKAAMHVKLGDALDKFIDYLAAGNNGDTISRNDFIKKLEQLNAPWKKYLTSLFGSYETPDELFDRLDVEGTGMLTFNDLNIRAGQKGFDLLSDWRLEAAPEVPTTQLAFLSDVVDTLTLNTDEYQLKQPDEARSIGINTQYLQTLDFTMENADKEYLIQQGKVATLAFLHEYLQRKLASEAGAECDRSAPGMLPYSEKQSPLMARYRHEAENN